MKGTKIYLQLTGNHLRFCNISVLRSYLQMLIIIHATKFCTRWISLIFLSDVLAILMNNRTFSHLKRLP